MAFLVPNLRIFYFCIKLCNKANSRALISSMTMVFQNCCLKHSIKVFLVPILRIFIYGTKLEITQMQRYWFQIWKWFFGIPAQKYPSKAFFVLNVSIFYFWMELRILKNSRVLISKMAIICFKFQPKNTQMRTFLLKLKSFFFLIETLSELNFI